MKLSRSTVSPGSTGRVREKMGPAKAKVWNSPRSPQGSTVGGQVGEEVGIEGAAGEGGIEVARVNAGEMRAEAGGDHLLRPEFGGGDAEGRAPDGEDGFEAGSGELFDAVGADVFEEEVAKSDSVEAFGGGAGADVRPCATRSRRWSRGREDRPSRAADPMEAACWSRSSSRKPWMATRRNFSLIVVRSATTSYLFCWRSRCSAQALSLPPLQLSRMRFRARFG